MNTPKGTRQSEIDGDIPGLRSSIHDTMGGSSASRIFWPSEERYDSGIINWSGSIISMSNQSDWTLV